MLRNSAIYHLHGYAQFHRNSYTTVLSQHSRLSRILTEHKRLRVLWGAILWLLVRMMSRGRASLKAVLRIFMKILLNASQCHLMSLQKPDFLFLFSILLLQKKVFFFFEMYSTAAFELP
jgi:hypothetical protein